MTPELPTTGALARRIADDLAGGLSVLLTGLPGSGRTHVAALVARDLGLAGANVVALRGNPMFADRPLASLALAGIGTEDAPSPTTAGSRLTRAVTTFGTLVGRPKSVVIIDDASALDAASVGVIADVRARSGTPLLIVAAPGTAETDLVADLVAATQPGVGVTLSGLPLEDITRLTGALLDGVVGAETLSRIAALSGGLPGLIEAIVRIGRRNGALRRDDAGVWSAPGDLWDQGWTFALLPFLGGLAPDERAGLDAIAAAGGLTPAEADRRLGTAIVRALTQRGLLYADPLSVTSDIHVFPPGLAEWLRRTGSPEPTNQPLVPGADLGRWPTGPHASALADRIRAQVQAEVATCWDRWNAERTVANAVPLLAALFSGAAGDERIALVLARTSPKAGEDTTPLVALAAMHRAAWGHDLAGALAALRTHEKANPQAATYLRGVAARLTLVLDRVPGPDLLAPSDQACDGDDILGCARADALLAQGRVREASDVLARVVPRGGKVGAVKATLEGLAQVLGDDVGAGVETAVKHLRDAVAALDAYSVSGHAYVAALGLCLLGRLDEVESVVEVVHRQGDTNVFQNHYKAGLLLLGSFIADWSGRREYARDLALQAKSLGAGRGPFPGMMADPESLFTASVSPEAVWDEMDELLARGYLVAAVFSAVAGIELDPGTTRAQAVVAAGAASQSRVLRALCRYIAAVNTGDYTHFEEVVADLRASCGPLDATRATITWALARRARGDLTGALELADAAWRESARIARAGDGLFRRLVVAVDLTPREAEVASLVTTGLSSSDIAAKVGLSTRTVEAYLHAVYRKTGVNTRDDLRHLATTWLALRP
ncbi:MAG: LuxR C-terminal-related transcriptional regulator [Actinomycetia bacterium]|nr:LuxR C-terminal-related transcriptional regulator [Actinomycetes bacterium]